MIYINWIVTIRRRSSIPRQVHRPAIRCIIRLRHRRIISSTAMCSMHHWPILVTHPAGTVAPITPSSRTHSIIKHPNIFQLLAKLGNDQTRKRFIGFSFNQITTHYVYIFSSSYGPPIAEHSTRSPGKEEESSLTGASATSVYPQPHQPTDTHSPELLSLESDKHQNHNNIHHHHHHHNHQVAQLQQQPHVSTDDSQRLTRTAGDWAPLTPPQ